MEDIAQYEQYTKEELIQVIMDLKKEIEALYLLKGCFGGRASHPLEVLHL